MTFLSGMGSQYVGQGLVRIGVDTSEVRRGMARATTEIEASARGWGRAMALAKVGLVGVVGAVVGFGAAGISAALSFEKAWAGVRKTVRGTPEELARLRGEFRQLAKEIPLSVNELAKIGETAGALGIPTKSITDFTRTVALLGSVTNVSADKAAMSLGQLGNVLGLRDRDYQRFGSTLVDLGNKGASTEAQILEVASRAGAAGKLIGLSTPAILAWGSAVASLGIQVEAGGSALQNFFLLSSRVVNGVQKGTSSARAQAEAHARLRIATEALAAATAKHGASSLQAQRAQLALSKAQDQVAASTGTSSKALARMAQVAGMTVPAFVSLFRRDATSALATFLAGLGKLPAGAQQSTMALLGLSNIRVVRAILGLAGNAGELNRQLKVGEDAWRANTALAAAAATRFDTAAAQIQLLKNGINDLFISLGDRELPGLKALVGFLRTDLPRGAAYLAGIWTTTLAPAAGVAAAGVGRLLGALGDLVSTGGPGSGAATVVQSLANVLAYLARVIGTVTSAAGGLLSNPIVAWLARLVILATAARVAFSGTAAAVRGMTSGTSRLASYLTGGRLGTSAAGAGATPLDGSAKALSGSAADLRGAAGAIRAAAEGRYVGGYSDPFGKMGRPSPTGAFREIAFAPAEAGVPNAMSATGKAADARRRAFARLSAEEQATQRLLAAPADWVGSLSLRDRVGKPLKSGISAIGGFLNKAFWPLMIADLGTELIKAPLGDFLASSTPFKRAGERMKDDFWGGLVDLFGKSMQGADAAVGHASTMQIGQAHFSTVALAKLGVTSATFDKLEAPAGTILHAEGLLDQSKTSGLTTDIARQVGESTLAWYRRIGAKLPDEVKAQASAFFSAQGYRGQRSLADEAGLAQLLAGYTSSAFATQQQAILDDYRTALRADLTGRGFTVGQLAQLNVGQLANLGHLAAADTTNQWTGVRDFLTRSYLDEVGATTRQKTAGQRAMSAETRSRVRALSREFGSGWQATVDDLVSGSITGQARARKAHPEVVRRLRQMFGDDWDSILRDTFRALRPPARTGLGATLSTELAALGRDQKAAQAAIEDYYKTVPQEIRDALDRFVQQAPERLDAGTLAALRKKFGADWLTAMRDGAGGLERVSRDKGLSRAMLAAFGPGWQEQLREFGNLLFAREGGKDAKTLAAALRGAISKEVGRLTAEDLAPPGGRTPGAARTRALRAQVSSILSGDAAALDASTIKALRSALGKNWQAAVRTALSDLASPDLGKSKDAMDTLGRALKKAIPDPAQRAQFVGALAALEKASKTSHAKLEDALTALSSSAPGVALQQVASALERLTPIAMRFVSAASGGGSGPPARYPHTPGDRRSAAGAHFRTTGTTRMTVGEAGGTEEVAVIAHPRDVFLRLVDDIVSGVRSGISPAQLAGAPARAGTTRQQYVSVDRMYTLYPRDEESLIRKFRFMEGGEH